MGAATGTISFYNLAGEYSKSRRITAPTIDIAAASLGENVYTCHTDRVGQFDAYQKETSVIIAGADSLALLEYGASYAIFTPDAVGANVPPSRCFWVQSVQLIKKRVNAGDNVNATPVGVRLTADGWGNIFFQTDRNQTSVRGDLIAAAGLSRGALLGLGTAKRAPTVAPSPPTAPILSGGFPLTTWARTKWHIGLIIVTPDGSQFAIISDAYNSYDIAVGNAPDLFLTNNAYHIDRRTTEGFEDDVHYYDNVVATQVVILPEALVRRTYATPQSVISSLQSHTGTTVDLRTTRLRKITPKGNVYFSWADLGGTRNVTILGSVDMGLNTQVQGGVGITIGTPTSQSAVTTYFTDAGLDLTDERSKGIDAIVSIANSPGGFSILLESLSGGADSLTFAPLDITKDFLYPLYLNEGKLQAEQTKSSYALQFMSSLVSLGVSAATKNVAGAAYSAISLAQTVAARQELENRPATVQTEGNALSTIYKSEGACISLYFYHPANEINVTAAVESDMGCYYYGINNKDLTALFLNSSYHSGGWLQAKNISISSAHIDDVDEVVGIIEKGVRVYHA